jgi:ankyrin repeat protein
VLGFGRKARSKALFAAVSAGDTESLSRLLRKNPRLEDRNGTGWTCLLEAISRGDEAAVKLLLEHGSNPNAKCPAKLEIAQQDVAKELYRRGLQPQSVVREGSWAPLLEAVSRGHKGIVLLLIAHGADVNIACLGKVDPGDFVRDSQFRSMGSKVGLSPYRRDNWTPLMEAGEHGHVAVVETLLNSGANANAATLGGDTALMRAGMAGHTATVEAILGGKASIDAVNNDGWTALFFAAAQGHVDTVRVLLDNGADANKKNKGNATALMWAVRANTETVQALLAAGARVNEISDKGGSALMAAVMLRRAEVVRVLLDAGADANATDKLGNPVAVLAQQTGDQQIVAMIENAVG